MGARRPRPGSRSLVMPAGRRIPRSPSPSPRRPAPPDTDLEADPHVLKAAGELAEVWAQIRGCEGCGRSSAGRAYGSGHPRAPVMLVKERPSAEDIESTNAFTSEAEALTKAFEALGIPVSWLYGTSVVRCGDRSTTGGELQACAVHLLAEIEAVGPRVIVAFGPAAADGLAALDGRCGLSFPEDLGGGRPVPIRSDVRLLVTEPLPEGTTEKEAKRRLWRDLQALPGLIGPA